MAISKIILNGVTQMDVTNITATEADVAQGKTFMLADGTVGTGTNTGGGSSATLISKNITTNGTYSAQDDSADGYSSVTVNVPASGITPTGSINITTNGTHDVTNYASANVNVQPNLQTKSVTPTKSQQTVSPDSNYDGLSSVTVNAIPNEYITTTDATASASDIVNGATAYVNGSKVTGSLVINKYYTGSSAPSSSLGNDGDIYLKVVS